MGPPNKRLERTALCGVHRVGGEAPPLNRGVGPIERTRGTRLGKNETERRAEGGLLALRRAQIPRIPRSTEVCLGHPGGRLFGPEPLRVTAAGVTNSRWVSQAQRRYPCKQG